MIITSLRATACTRLSSISSESIASFCWKGSSFLMDNLTVARVNNKSDGVSVKISSHE